MDDKAYAVRLKYRLEFRYRKYAVKRREFIHGCGAAMMAASCKSAPRTDRLWGTPNGSALSSLLSPDRRPEGMLEVFCLGGLSPWETFYTVPDFNRPGKGGKHEGQQWWTWQKPVAGMSVPEFAESCLPGGYPLTQPFALDGSGVQVNLGPFIAPLRDRPDILKRMRVWVMAHNTEPHEAAIPYAITGHELGNPRLTSLGAHIQRYHTENGPSDRTAPYSYAISMSSLNVSNNGTAAWATGSHPASARPLSIRLGQESSLIDQLPRTGVAGFTGPLDDLVAHYNPDGARAVEA